MKTDDLINILTTNVEPVDRRQVAREILAIVALGAIAVIAVIWVTMGIRSDLMQGETLIHVLLKLAFAAGVVAVATAYLMRVARPGGEKQLSITWLALPFAMTMLVAGASLTLTSKAHWEAMIVGDQWLECLLSIPIIAIMPFTAVIWVMRRMAPTDLTRAGALAGLLSGGLSAIGYALHCTDDSLPFVALWYGGTIALCTFAGAKLGPRLLRW